MRVCGEGEHEVRVCGEGVLEVTSMHLLVAIASYCTDIARLAHATTGPSNSIGVHQ